MTGAKPDPELVVAGERLVLLPQRALFWPARSTLLIADPHFGKAATFRAEGLPVPSGTTREALGRIDAALDRTGANRIVFLGDFLHARSGRDPDTLATIARWGASRVDLELLLVRGNHDRGAGDPPPELRVRCVDPPVRESPFVLAHHPVTDPGGYVLAGHLHPGIRLRGAGGLRARLPCFWFGDRLAVLPAFGDFTGLALVEPGPVDRVFAVADEIAVEVQAGGR